MRIFWLVKKYVFVLEENTDLAAEREAQSLSSTD